MSLESAESLYHGLIETIKNFKSPAFKDYFLRKADSDFKELKRQIKNGKYSCVIKPYLKDQSELLDVLKRQTVIYNMYNDKNSNI